MCVANNRKRQVIRQVLRRRAIRRTRQRRRAIRRTRQQRRHHPPPPQSPRSRTKCLERTLYHIIRPTSANIPWIIRPHIPPHIPPLILLVIPTQPIIPTQAIIRTKAVMLIRIIRNQVFQPINHSGQVSQSRRAIQCKYSKLSFWVRPPSQWPPLMRKKMWSFWILLWFQLSVPVGDELLRTPAKV